jgi:hypothetical protein
VTHGPSFPKSFCTRWIGVAALALGGCGTAPPLRVMACDAAPAAAVVHSADGREASAQLSVLTYNLEGLGWPARNGRAKELKEIGERLNAARATGSGADIILFQEMFSGAAKRAVAAAVTRRSCRGRAAQRGHSSAASTPWPATPNR